MKVAIPRHAPPMPRWRPSVSKLEPGSQSGFIPSGQSCRVERLFVRDVLVGLRQVGWGLTCAGRRRQLRKQLLLVLPEFHTFLLGILCFRPYACVGFRDLHLDTGGLMGGVSPDIRITIDRLCDGLRGIQKEKRQGQKRTPSHRTFLTYRRRDAILSIARRQRFVVSTDHTPHEFSPCSLARLRLFALVVTEADFIAHPYDDESSLTSNVYSVPCGSAQSKRNAYLTVRN